MDYRKDKYRKGDLNAVEITQIGTQKCSYGNFLLFG